ncbi:MULTISPECIES: hypothetical protein [unclassified Lebetimonas]|uniref:hypothetical protein n=1 Tax=unclassified Lebetimonas TaxID=2648158 RepID=UPI0004B6E1E2|nr:MULTISPECIES: hypothetical protein [unclassified Lebetimonas]
MKAREIQITKIRDKVYQIIIGKVGIVISAKDEIEAKVKACRLLGLNCSKLFQKRLFNA